MNIGFALYDYYPFGGLQEDCLATALATAARGHCVHIFARTWKGYQPDNVQVHILGTKGISNTSRNDHYFKALNKTLPDYELDGLVAFNRVPNADIYFAADPCYVERHKDATFWQKLSARYRYYTKLEAKLFNPESPPHTLVLTEGESEAIRKHYQIPRGNFHLLPPGITRNTQTPEQQQNNRSELRTKYKVPEGAVISLFVGSGFRVKGLHRALLALKANAQAAETHEFWVIGNGKPENYRTLVKNAGIPVRFFGGRDDVPKFYDAADFLLHPAYSESAGKVLLEALSHGLPVLTTDTCGYAANIQSADAGAVLSSPFSQDMLNQTLQKFITDADTRRKWSRNAKMYTDINDLYSCHETAAETIERILSGDDLDY
ncbi:MAG: glycosyltransferase family 4 protein [Opitutaceae bacterium]